MPDVPTIIRQGVLNGQRITFHIRTTDGATERIHEVEARLELSGDGVLRIGPAISRPAEPAESAEEQEARRLARRLENEKRHELRIKAKEKAKETLFRLLSPDQLKTAMTNGYFDVQGSEGNRYRIEINYGYTGNVYWIGDDGSVLGNFCCHPTMRGRRLGGGGGDDWMPTEDAYIGQKLSLECDELGFLRSAVIEYGALPPVVRLKHTDELVGDQRCRCDGCGAARTWSMAW